MSDAQSYGSGTLPVLPVTDVAAAADYYTGVLGFREVMRQPMPDGTVVNARVELDNCHFMFNLNPEHAGNAGGGVYFWVRIDGRDIDAYYKGLLEANVEIVEEIKDQFWGDRSFTIKDANGYFIAFNKALQQ